MKKPIKKNIPKKSKVVPLKPREGFEVVEYEDSNGKNHYNKWFLKLPPQHASKVTDALRRMEFGNLGDHHGVNKGVFEHRIKTPALRIYFGKDGNELIVLLAGGDKNTQSKDIDKAHTLWQEYKAKKKEKTKP